MIDAVVRLVALGLAVGAAALVALGFVLGAVLF